MSITIKAGQLRDVLEIQRKSATGNSLGQPSSTWPKVTTVRGKITTLIGTEAEKARQLVPQATVEITIRYSALVKAGDRIVSDGVTYNVGLINDVDRRHHKMILTCSEPKSV